MDKYAKGKHLIITKSEMAVAKTNLQTYIFSFLHKMPPPYYKLNGIEIILECFNMVFSKKKNNFAT